MANHLAPPSLTPTRRPRRALRDLLALRAERRALDLCFSLGLIFVLGLCFGFFALCPPARGAGEGASAGCTEDVSAPCASSVTIVSGAGGAATGPLHPSSVHGASGAAVTGKPPSTRASYMSKLSSWSSGTS